MLGAALSRPRAAESEVPIMTEATASTQIPEPARARQAVQQQSSDPLRQIALGHQLSVDGRFAEAALCFERALALDPLLPMAHNNLGWIREQRGETDAAIASYRRALELNGALALAQNNLAALLMKLGCFREAVPLWSALLDASPDDGKLLDDIIEQYLRGGAIAIAADFADRCASLNRGSRWHCLAAEVPAAPLPQPPLSAGKLRHDVAQLKYLRARRLIGAEFAKVIANHERLLEQMLALGEDARKPFGDAERALIGDVYGRIVHQHRAPRVERIFSESWSGAEAEKTYLNNPLGVVVVDDFLSPQALEGVRRFCRELTVWFTNRYRYGRLGAFFRDGFNAPLLVQIAEELRQALPRIIGGTYPLTQLWGYKYAAFQPPTPAHADFAAVNVNFWITPEEANCNKESGGMIIYDVQAPPEWDFDSYNRQGTKIEDYLRTHSAHARVIPYRANRAIIFNSDLFHATAPIDFDDTYENRRINVTMLYGRRGNRRTIARGPRP